ncbi:MAG: cadherin-like domain-containing protein, partial [Planctomycetales bacterium]|nr:cadherin-like domain-containing protein [Planctomycetales bacterium]
VVDGSLEIKGDLEVTLLTSFASVGDQFTIISNTSGNPTTGIFNGLPEGGLVSYGGNVFDISYVGGTGNDVVLTTLTVNHFPTGDSQSITTSEETPVNIVLTGNDIDGDLFTFSIDSGPSHGSLTGSGANYTYTPFTNYAGSDAFVFKVTDSNGGFSTATVSITVDPVQDPPTQLSLAPTTVAENSAVGTSVGTLSTSDPDAGDTFTYALASGTGDANNSLFSVSGDQLQLGFVPDFESQSSYSVRVRSTDAGGNPIERAFTINISDVNENPTSLSLSNNSVTENSASGTVVGTLSSTDPDANPSFTYSLVPGTGSADNSAFTIDGNQLKITAVPDFESQCSYSIRVRSTDHGGLFVEHVFSIGVLDLNEAPVINDTDLSVSSSEVNEGDTITLSGSFTAEDGGDAHNVTIDWGDGSNTTILNVLAGVTSFSVSHIVADDHPTATSSDVTTINVTVDDGILSDSAAAFVTVNNVSPTIENQSVTTSISENGVATLTADIVDPSTLDSYTLVVDWGEGSPETVNIPAGSTSFSVSHQYLDDNPSGTIADVYNISIISFEDDDGGSAGLVHGGSIFLTGHDILSHSPLAQNHFDDIALDYLRGKGTPLEIARSDYTIGLFRSSTFVPGATPINGTAFGGVILANSSNLSSETAFRNYLSQIDVLVLPENSNTALLNTYSAAIEDFFNAGGDLFLDTSNGQAGYYAFLPSVIGADGPGINFSTGFSATPAGVAIGITSNMINGFPTHNRFINPDPAFTILETHSVGIVSIGAQNVVLSDGGISANLAVTVNNVSPNFEAGGDETLPATTVAFDRTINFTDPGSQDSHTVTVDFGDSTGPQSFAVSPTGNRGFVLNHDFPIVGPPSSTYTVSVTVADDDLGSLTDTFDVTVIRNTPPTADAGGPYSVLEGGAVMLDGSNSLDSEQSTASLHYLWDLDGDGIFGETGGTAARGDEVGINPLFDAAGLDGPSSVTVTLRVTDDFGEFDSDTATISITNVAPTLDPLILSSTAVDENGMVTVNGTFNDPGALDVHQVVIDWGEGGGVLLDQESNVNRQDWSGAIQSNQSLAQTFTVGQTGNLTRVDVRGSNSIGGSGDFVVKILGTTAGVPDESQLLATLTVPVTSFPTTPNAEFVAIDLSGSPVAVSVGQVLAIVLENGSSVDFAVGGPRLDEYADGSVFSRDPSGANTWGSFSILDADMRFRTYVSTGSTTVLTLPVGQRSFTASHQYLDDNPSGSASDTYTISATVTDDDSLSDNATVTVTVDDVAPTLTLDAVTTINENG